MNGCIFYYPGGTAATDHAVHVLRRLGCLFCDTPDSNVTDLLLPVPYRQPEQLPVLLSKLPKGIRIFGGRLPCPEGYRVHDLLQDPFYTAQNASITAYCAVRLMMERLPVVLKGCPVLVIGWGRIGKALARVLQSLGARVTVAARKESDRAMLAALGYDSIPTDGLQGDGFSVICNTVPFPVLPNCPQACVAIDLASTKGLGGDHVLHATGLPGKLAPKSSGELIAQTVIRLLEKGDSV